MEALVGTEDTTEAPAVIITLWVAECTITIITLWAAECTITIITLWVVECCTGPLAATDAAAVCSP